MQLPCVPCVVVTVSALKLSRMWYGQLPVHGVLRLVRWARVNDWMATCFFICSKSSIRSSQETLIGGAMSPLYAIMWFITLMVSICIVFRFIGIRTLIVYFPEGRRWWHLPAQLGSLAFFAVVVLNHPFK